MSLDEALDTYQVMERDPECEWWPEGLDWGVTCPAGGIGGVIALFATEEAACAYRLALVNQACNPNWSSTR